MCRFIESIKFQSGFYHLPYHQRRLDRTFRHFFKEHSFQLSEHLEQLEAPNDDQKYKCRIEYDNKSLHAEFVPYHHRVIRKATVVETARFDYAFKFADRKTFSELTSGLPSDHEVIIVIDQLLTDSSYSNLALLREGKWFTPLSPLLEGTKRQYLLDKDQLIPIDIHVDELGSFEKIAFINSMLDLGELELAISPATVIRTNRH